MDFNYPDSLRFVGYLRFIKKGQEQSGKPCKVQSYFLSKRQLSTDNTIPIVFHAFGGSLLDAGATTIRNRFGTIGMGHNSLCDNRGGSRYGNSLCKTENFFFTTGYCRNE